MFGGTPLVPLTLMAGSAAWIALWLYFSRGRLHHAGWVIRLLRTSPGPAVVLMLFAASLDLVFGGASVRDLEAVSDSPLTGPNMARAILLGLVGVWSTVVLLSSGRILAQSFRLPTGAFIAYGVVGLASVPFSSMPFVSLGKSLEVLIAGMAVAAIITSLLRLPVTFRSDVAGWLWGFVIGALVLRLTVFWVSASLQSARAFLPSEGALSFVPGLGFYGAIHPNTLGMLGAIVALVSLTRVLRQKMKMTDRVFWTAIGFLGIASLVASQARTSLLAFVVLLPLAMWLVGRLRLALVAGFGGLFMVAAYLPTIGEYVLRGQGEALFLSLSGRVFYWSEAWQMILERPLQGFGFYTGVRVDLNERYAALDLSTVDQTFLEVALNNGLLGLLPFSTALLSLGLLLARGVGGASKPGLPAEMLLAFGVIFFRAMLGPSVQTFSLTLVVLVPMLAWAGQAGYSSGRLDPLRRGTCLSAPTVTNVRHIPHGPSRGESASG